MTLHIFYNPKDLDSCLAAWATRHGLGEKATELHPGSIEFHEDMLLLNRAPVHLENLGEHAAILAFDCGSTHPDITIAGDITLASRGSPVACCILTWARFHASPAPWVLQRYDDMVLGNEKPPVLHTYNAMLAQDWSMRNLDKVINDFENPKTRIDLLLDGQVILSYRKLRGDLCPA